MSFWNYLHTLHFKVNIKELFCSRFFFFRDRVSFHNPDWCRTYHVIQAGLRLGDSYVSVAQELGLKCAPPRLACSTLVSDSLLPHDPSRCAQVWVSFSTPLFLSLGCSHCLSPSSLQCPQTSHRRRWIPLAPSAFTSPNLLCQAPWTRMAPGLPCSSLRPQSGVSLLCLWGPSFKTNTHISFHLLHCQCSLPYYTDLCFSGLSCTS